MLGAIVQGLGSGAVLALAAVGLVLVFRGSRVINLAQGEIGAFALFTAVAVTGHRTSAAVGVAVLVLATVMGAAFALLVEMTVMRRLVERPAIHATIATLGVAIVLIDLELLLGRPGLFLAAGQSSYPIAVPATVGTATLRVGGAVLHASQIAALVAVTAVGAGLYWLLSRTRFGLAVVAATTDISIARLLGVPVHRVHLFTWGVGGALSGLAAALIAPFSGGFTPATMTFVVISALAAVVIGGLDSLPGALIGSLLVGVVQAVTGYSFGGSAAAGHVAVLVLVIGTLLVRPRGLLGSPSVEL